MRTGVHGSDCIGSLRRRHSVGGWRGATVADSASSHRIVANRKTGPVVVEADMGDTSETGEGAPIAGQARDANVGTTTSATSSSPAASNPPEVSSTPPVSKLPLVIAGAIAVIATLAIMGLLATRGPEVYADGTPEAAVQTYVNAALEAEQETFRSLLTPRFAACQTDFDRGFGDDWWQPQQDLSAKLLSMSTSGTEATARVQFRAGNRSDAFNSSSWEFIEMFSLNQIDGEWLVDEARWPHVLQQCVIGG